MANIPIQCTPELKRAVKFAALNSGRTVSGLVRHWIVQNLKELENADAAQTGPNKQSAVADAGRVQHSCPCGYRAPDVAVEGDDGLGVHP